MGSLVFGDEEEVLDYKIATCCQPISGDKVFGFITIKEGIKIHAISCPNAIRLRTNFSYRIVNCKWKSLHTIEFDALIEIKGIDSVGLVNKITNIILSRVRGFMKFELLHDPSKAQMIALECRNLLTGWHESFIKTRQAIEDSAR